MRCRCGSNARTGCPASRLSGPQTEKHPGKPGTVLRVTVTQVLYECGVNENLIVQMLRSRCHCTENEAVNLYVYEKTTRAPIRALQNYLEAEKGFPPDSKKSVYGLAFDKMSSEPDCRNASPEEFYARFGPEFEALKADRYFRDMRMETASDVAMVI